MRGTLHEGVARQALIWSRGCIEWRRTASSDFCP